jgi:uncharacterized protein YxjI
VADAGVTGPWEIGHAEGGQLLADGVHGWWLLALHGTTRGRRLGAMYVIRARFFSVGDDFDITDDTGRVVYHVDGRAFSLRNRLVIEDPDGQEMATVERHLVSLRPTYAVTIGGEKAADVRKHLFTPFRDKFTIDIPGPGDLEVTGHLLDHEFTIERDGDQVAAVSKRWFSLRDTYGVEVADGEDDLLVLASVLAVELALDRERADGD